MTVALWQNGLTPEVRKLKRGYTPVKSLKEAIDRSRRLEESEPVTTDCFGNSLRIVYHHSSRGCAS
ncbi:unnamed protein product [Ectocarpus sp. CCAP 1310/34]|nr:unnamed protein product [Ectocarpus sp. CCAP 1310/34]